MLKKALLVIAILLNLQIFGQVSYVIRHIQKSDGPAFQDLYYNVASNSAYLALLPHEITQEYITNLVDTVINNGLGLVVECDNRLIGWMLKHRYHCETSRHVFYGGSIGVHPMYQGQGVGTKLITAFLDEVATNYTDILRVEIYALESNPAYHLYKKIGFVTEGIFKNAKLCSNGTLESYYSMVWFNPNFSPKI